MSDQLYLSESINKKRWRKFKSIKRGYYSFIIIISLYILSFLLPLLINSKALIVQYEGNYYFPAVKDVLPGLNAYYDGNKFGQDVPGETNYRQLQQEWKDTENWIIMPIYPFNPYEDITNNEIIQNVTYFLSISKDSKNMFNDYFFTENGILDIDFQSNNEDKINVKDCLDKNWISSEGSYVKIFEKKIFSKSFHSVIEFNLSRPKIKYNLLLGFSEDISLRVSKV